MPISHRYGLPVLALLFVTFSITLLTSRADWRVEDCANPERLTDPTYFESLIPFVELTKPNSEDVHFWVEGQIELHRDRSPQFQVYVIRSFDPLRIYLEPDNLAPMRAEPDKGSFEWVEINSELLPVHFLYSQTAGPAMRKMAFTTYMFVYGNEPVPHPLSAQLASPIQDIIYGNRPLTVLLVKGAISNVYLDEAKERAKEWLSDSLAKYRAACSP